MLGSVLSAIGLAALKIEARAIAQRVARQAALGVATGLLVLTALGLALAALTVWLAGLIGTIWALLAVAGGLLLIAAILQIVARAGSPRRRPRPADAPPPRRPAPREPEEESAQDPEQPPPGSALGSVAVVAVAGFLLARQMFRRPR